MMVCLIYIPGTQNGCTYVRKSALISLATQPQKWLYIHKPRLISLAAHPVHLFGLAITLNKTLLSDVVDLLVNVTVTT